MVARADAPGLCDDSPRYLDWSYHERTTSFANDILLRTNVLPIPNDFPRIAIYAKREQLFSTSPEPYRLYRDSPTQYLEIPHGLSLNLLESWKPASSKQISGSNIFLAFSACRFHLSQTFPLMLDALQTTCLCLNSQDATHVPLEAIGESADRPEASQHSGCGLAKCPGTIDWQRSFVCSV